MNSIPHCNGNKKKKNHVWTYNDIQTQCEAKKRTHETGRSNYAHYENSGHMWQRSGAFFCGSLSSHEISFFVCVAWRIKTELCKADNRLRRQNIISHLFITDKIWRSYMALLSATPCLRPTACSINDTVQHSIKHWTIRCVTQNLEYKFWQIVIFVMCKIKTINEFI